MKTLKDTKTIHINFNDINSIEYAEKRKFELECKGYELIENRSGVFNGTLVYQKTQELETYDVNNSFAV